MIVAKVNPYNVLASLVLGRNGRPRKILVNPLWSPLLDRHFDTSGSKKRTSNVNRDDEIGFL